MDAVGALKDADLQVFDGPAEGDYQDLMWRAKFCFVAYGHGWGIRLRLVRAAPALLSLVLVCHMYCAVVGCGLRRMRMCPWWCCCVLLRTTHVQPAAHGAGAAVCFPCIRW
jgi:hypothetical protein